MYRSAQLDRRRATSSSLRHAESSTLSSSSDDEVPVIDIYNNSGDAQVDPDDVRDKRTRGGGSSLAVMSIWRTITSLRHPFAAVRRGGRRLPRYDIQTSSSGLTDDEDMDDDVEEKDVQLIAVSSSTARLRPALEQTESSSSLESSPSPLYDIDDDTVDVLEAQAAAVSSTREEVLLYEKGSNKPRHAWILRRKEIDVEAYMTNREMSPLQEKCNALTMIPLPLFCIYYTVACCWIPAALVQELQQDVQTTGTAWPDHWLGQPAECLSPSNDNTWWSLPYLPPTPVLAVALGTILHTPWSMLYHWKYAHQLPPGAPRMNHWSRRMDHAVMHVASALLAYGTSGSWDYMMATGLFNADSAYRHFEHKVAPRRNKVRITLAVLAYSLPMLRSGHPDLFLEFWTVMGACGWLFAAYPIGGWSHTAFHALLVVTLWPLLQAASLTGAARDTVQMAAQCSVWNHPTSV